MQRPSGSLIRAAVAALLVSGATACAPPTRRCGLVPCGQLQIIEPGDFAEPDLSQAKPTTAGGMLLRGGVSQHQRVRDFVQLHGIPDGIAIDDLDRRQIAHQIQLAHRQRNTVAIFEDGQLVRERPLTPLEAENIDPNRYAARVAEGLRLRARVMGVAAKMMRALPAEAAGKTPGRWRGFTRVDMSPTIARIFGLPAASRGVVIDWVDPEGPSRDVVAAGDYVIRIGDRELWTEGGLWDRERETLDLTVVRGGTERRIQVGSEVWSRDIAFLLLDLPAPLAFVTVPSPHRYGPADEVRLTTTMVRLLDDDGLAWVIGHEIAHLVWRAGPPPARSASDRAIDALLAAAWIPARLVPVAGAPFQLAIQSAQNRSSRDEERAVDELGLRYMAAAGFRPEAAPLAIERVEQAATSNVLLEFIGTHPSYPERAARLRTLATSLPPPADDRAPAPLAQ
jgi:hypothetical protein